jgi:hypothetical protein
MGLKRVRRGCERELFYSAAWHRSHVTHERDLGHLLSESRTRIRHLECALTNTTNITEPSLMLDVGVGPDTLNSPPVGQDASVQTGAEEENTIARQSRRKKSVSWDLWSTRAAGDGVSDGDADVDNDDWPDWDSDEDENGWWLEPLPGTVPPPSSPLPPRRERVPQVVQIAVPEFRQFDWESCKDVLQAVEDEEELELHPFWKDLCLEDSLFEEDLMDTDEGLYDVVQRAKKRLGARTFKAVKEVLIKPRMRPYVEKIFRERVVVPAPPKVEACRWRAERMERNNLFLS